MDRGEDTLLNLKAGGQGSTRELPRVMPVEPSEPRLMAPIGWRYPRERVFSVYDSQRRRAEVAASARVPAHVLGNNVKKCSVVHGPLYGRPPTPRPLMKASLDSTCSNSHCTAAAALVPICSLTSMLIIALPTPGPDSTEWLIRLPRRAVPQTTSGRPASCRYPPTLCSR